MLILVKELLLAILACLWHRILHVWCSS